MATVCLNKEACQSSGVSLGEALLLLAIHNEVDLAKAEDLLVQKGFITATRDELFKVTGWRITRTGSQILEDVLHESSKSMTKTKAERKKEYAGFLALAERLKAVFPEGKKRGTTQQWSEGPILIAKRLDKFFEKYGKDKDGNRWTDDQIVDAAERYVQSFNGEYQFMRVLKYFLWKEDTRNGVAEPSSDLYNYLTNIDQQDEDNDNWRDSVR